MADFLGEAIDVVERCVENLDNRCLGCGHAHLDSSWELNIIAYMNCERISGLIREIIVDLGRPDGPGQRDITIFHLILPYRRELMHAKVSGTFEADQQTIDNDEFQQIIKCLRKIAQKMPEFMRIENISISPTDSLSKAIGWCNLDKRPTSPLVHGKFVNFYKSCVEEVADEEDLKRQFKIN